MLLLSAFCEWNCSSSLGLRGYTLWASVFLILVNGPDSLEQNVGFINHINK